jgi:hypothetical protein
MSCYCINTGSKGVQEQEMSRTNLLQNTFATVLLHNILQVSKATPLLAANTVLLDDSGSSQEVKNAEKEVRAALVGQCLHSTSLRYPLKAGLD